MASKKKLYWGSIALLSTLIILGAVLWGPIVSNVEQAKYTTVEKIGNIEIREYPPMIVAETIVTGERKTAISEGFRLVADFIFGNNSRNEKVAMTAPVIQQAGEKIAMTAPVTQQASGSSWIVRFVMPSSYSVKTLPNPNNPKVRINEIPGKRFVTINFSGVSSKENLKKNEILLLEFVRGKQLNVSEVPVYAFFNPPWTLPFLRRNEIMMEVK